MKPCVLWASLITLLSSMTAGAEDRSPLAQAFASTKPIANARLRFEGVDQEPLARDAAAMTLRARFGFETGTVSQRETSPGPC
jgi:hypothetical protein